MTSIRFAIIFIILIVLAFAITWWPTNQAKNMIIEQKKLSAQATSQLKQAQADLAYLPSINPANVRKAGSFKLYSDQAQQASDRFNKITLIRPPDLQPIFGISTNSEYGIIKDVNSALAQIHQKTMYTNSRNDTETADKLMAYHAAVSKALVNILEYDPVADMQSFSLNSSDSQQRLKLAHDGLIKTDQQLQDAKKLFADTSIDEVTAQISGLRYARFQLSQNGDTAAWIKAIEEAQDKIIQNRINFWKHTTDPIKTKLADDQIEMLKINSLWNRLAQKYRLS